MAATRLQFSPPNLSMISPKTRQTSAAVAAHYDQLDDFYRDIWGSHVHHGYWVTGKETADEATEALIDLLAGRLDLSQGQETVDIGCGYGATARYLAKHYGLHVTGLSISLAQVRQAQATPATNVSIQHADWLANALPDQKFGRAYAIESSEHMPDKQRFFDEAFRTLKPGGLFGICAWLAAENPKAWEIRHLLEPICREGRLPGMGTAAEYRAMAVTSGFETVSFEDISANVSKTWVICAQRLGKAVLTQPRYLKFLLNRGQENRVFALTLFRLLLAYRTGAMRYGLLVFRKPERF
jgi:tocopherol O-methyltransferase